MAWNRAPLVVRVKTTGRKTTQVVRVEATMAPATSVVPARAASILEAPSSSRLRTMLSRTTMALSTIIPTPRARPPKVIWLSVIPPKNRRPKVEITEMGMERAMIIVLDRLRRNR